jgi:L-asparaginase
VTNKFYFKFAQILHSFIRLLKQKIHVYMCSCVYCAAVGLWQALRLVPGFDDECIERIVEGDIKGLVLLVYGAGGADNTKPRMFAALRKAIDRGITVVACSQCLRGDVNFNKYAAASSLKTVGVISAGDMTCEAAVTKLAMLLSKDLTREQVSQEMTQDLRGELTVSKPASASILRSFL